MLRVISEGLWAEIKKLARRNRKAAAIAYVTSDRDIKFGKGDVLVCDASDASIQSGQTAVPALRAAVRRGASVYSAPGLHAKAMVLGRIAVVGSANASESSASQLVEAALITDDARAVAGVRVLVEQLMRDADPVDAAFLKRASELKVRAPRKGGRRRKAVRVDAPRAWIISVAPLAAQRFENESKLVKLEQEIAERHRQHDDSDAGYVRWTGSSGFRREARPGDLVIQVWTAGPKSKRGKVYAPEPLLHRRDDGKVTHFFIEEYADRENSAIPFMAFKRLWTGLGNTRPLTVKSTRVIAVERLEAARATWPRATVPAQ